MRKLMILVIVFVIGFSQFAKADEGMWFLAFINKNYADMKAKGLKLSIDDIYNINNASLKDAVVSLDRGGCTGEIISQYGLLLTNHHCGYEEIQSHSTVEHDYLTDGFWAMTKEQELPNPGKTVSFLIKVEDVTDKVLAEIKDEMTEEERESVVKQISDRIQKEAVKGTNYEAEVKSFFKGNNYYLCVYEVFRDIRLVGAPPSSIGKYGADTDNWMWPRHTGDFSIFRVYCAPDGSPADYSPENVPYQPKRFLSINIGGVKENDFTMIMGYPGTTNRFLTSWGVKQTMEHENAIRIKVRDVRQTIIKKDMDSDPKIRIQYSAKYSTSTNYYKYSIGQNQGLNALKVYDRKQEIEKNLAAWVKAGNKERTEKYNELFKLIEDAYKENDKTDIAQNYWFEALYLGPEFIQFGLKFRRIEGALQSGSNAKAKILAKSLKEESAKYFKDYNAPTDKKVTIALLKLYAENVEKEFLPSFYTDIKDNFAGDYEKFAEDIYNKSVLTDSTRFNAFLNNLQLETLTNDPAYKVMQSALETYFGLQEKTDAANAKLSKGERLFVDAFLKMKLEKNAKELFYPDANSTMRLTYGTVGGYKTADKTFEFTTDLEGYMKKEDPNNEEFVVSPKLKELYNKKDYGRYGKNGKMTVCFISNNDITGGNSGSPVMNANGELIGVAFDGNWEAMSGDIAFEPALQRTICVDIRFVLFVIEKYAGATNLINEMKIIEK